MIKITVIRTTLFFSFLMFFITGFKSNFSDPQPHPPEENRFKRVVLVEKLYNPMQLQVAPDGTIYMIEGNGKVSRINPQTKAITTIGTVKNLDNREFGLIGMALDPDFERTQWIYLYYFLPQKGHVGQLSRFTIAGDSLELSSEKKYVQIPNDPTCCHTGGSLSFDSKGNLYFSTGDNASASMSVYSPHDERPGKEFGNALRSAANTMDLRGKICRIHPEDDGTFSIPADNLFADGKNGRPEIYIMGCRNPWRIFVDKTTDVLYWGEVGPDADRDSTYGPRGYDEFNIATKAGNYGWPMFIGDNKPYAHVDFETNTAGEKFNPQKPVNFSRLNTGVKNLPPAQKATIWYPYVKSPDFPQLGEGGRTAMGGPVYHYDPNLKSAVKFPKYYDKAWFIGDWMRNWLKVAHLDAQYKLQRIDDFMPSTKFEKPINMAFSPKDGALYLLEYGDSWQANPEARLVRIEYNGNNRSPVAHLEANKLSGKQPLSVLFSAIKSFDYDHDRLKYVWTINNLKIKNQLSELRYTFKRPGIYSVGLKVIDPSGASSVKSLRIMVGNSTPEVTFTLKNHSFYSDNMSYSVNVKDGEDGQLGKTIPSTSVKVNLTYFPKAGTFIKNASGQMISRGELLMNESDCKACHSQTSASIGPDFLAIANRYLPEVEKDEKIIDQLAQKIVSGGGGVWSKDKMMSAHPQLTTVQTGQIVRYILSLAEKKEPVKAMPVSGQLVISKDIRARKEGLYELEASYTDKGSNGIKPLTGTAKEILRYPKIYAEDFDNITYFSLNSTNHTLSGSTNSYATLKNIDLSGITKISLHAKAPGIFEIHIDSLRGKQVALVQFKDNLSEWQEVSGIFNSVQGRHDVYLLYVNEKHRFNTIQVDWLWFQ